MLLTYDHLFTLYELNGLVLSQYKLLQASVKIPVM